MRNPLIAGKLQKRRQEYWQRQSCAQEPFPQKHEKLSDGTLWLYAHPDQEVQNQKQNLLHEQVIIGQHLPHCQGKSSGLSGIPFRSLQDPVRLAQKKREEGWSSKKTIKEQVGRLKAGKSIEDRSCKSCLLPPDVTAQVPERIQRSSAYFRQIRYGIP